MRRQQNDDLGFDLAADVRRQEPGWMRKQQNVDLGADVRRQGPGWMRRQQNERERGGVDFAFLIELIERRELKDERLRGENVSG